jgi:zinc/manganese transport system ATP-binding protein
MTTSQATMTPMTTAARLDGVAAGYPGRVLWRDLDLVIEPGEFLAVLGGNGTGKTTLLKLLLGLMQPLAGTVTVLGSEPSRGDRRVGYVPQHASFDPDVPVRGVDLVRLGADGHRFGPRRASGSVRDRVAASLVAVGAESYADVPVGLLSGGEQQRLRIASAVVDDPAILLADEPLLSLDLASQQQVADVFDERRRAVGSAVVVVTHDVNPVLRHVDRVLYLANGQWAAGTPDEVLTSERLSELYGVEVDVVRVRNHIVIVGAPDEATGPHHGSEA